MLKRILTNNIELQFEIRESTSDESVINETIVRNVYNLKEDDFKNTGIFIDIGANIGTVSILVNILGAKEIIAFEPEEENFSYLKTNLQLNKVENVKYNKLAVWNKDDVMIDIRPHQSFTDVGEWNGRIKVRTITLSKILENYKEVDILKCDIEGAEYKIFDDIEANKKACKIVLEFHKTTQENFENLIATLSKTHNISYSGNYDSVCGMLEAIRL